MFADEFPDMEIDKHLYVLRKKLIRHPGVKLDEILKRLFENRSYQQLIHCHLAWNQILFFIFRTTKYAYTIHCVDVLESNRIHFDIRICKRAWPATVCFDQHNNFHIVFTSRYWRTNTKIHTTILSNAMVPEAIYKNNKRRNLIKIDIVCSFYSRKYQLHIPTALIGLVNHFHPIFKTIQ